MQLIVSGKNIDIGDSLRGHIHQALEGVTTRYFNNPIEATVILSKEANLFRSDMSVHIGRGIVIRCHIQDADPYASIDGAVRKLDKILRRHKNRLRDHHREGEAKELPGWVATQKVIAADQSEEQDGDSHPVVIAEMNTQIPSMSVSEAILRLDTSSMDFFMFKNISNQQLNVVFRRPDGNVGWVDPQLAK